jgi:hypothetical protein
VTTQQNTETAGGARGVPARPALSKAEQARRAARPVRDPDPIRTAFHTPAAKEAA